MGTQASRVHFQNISNAPMSVGEPRRRRTNPRREQELERQRRISQSPSMAPQYRNGRRPSELYWATLDTIQLDGVADHPVALPAYNSGSRFSSSSASSSTSSLTSSTSHARRSVLRQITEVAPGGSGRPNRTCGRSSCTSIGSTGSWESDGPCRCQARPRDSTISAYEHLQRVHRNHPAAQHSLPFATLWLDSDSDASADEY
eukprot:scpid69358/ scgid17463/ 